MASRTARPPPLALVAMENVRREPATRLPLPSSTVAITFVESVGLMVEGAAVTTTLLGAPASIVIF